MREIKFRGKRKDNEEWVYGYLSSPDTINVVIELQPNESDTSDGYCDEFVVDPATVGQYTGLYSANIDIIASPNKEAYIGDIIRLVNTDGREFIKELAWSDELCCVMIGNVSYQRVYESGYTQPSKLQFEIIGNIHDNPELLK